MKDKWYSDNRDLVKWGVLVELARRFAAEHILQLLYYRPTPWGNIEVDGREVELPTAVVQQFRNITNITSLQGPAKVEVIDWLFDDRDKYLQYVLGRIHVRPPKIGIVFLDPDTGLESRNPRPEHVLESEVKTIWDEMRDGDVLVVYQHQTNRSGTPWIEPKREQLEKAIGVLPGSAKIAWAPGIARDVVLFYVQKAHQTGQPTADT